MTDRYRCRQFRRSFAISFALVVIAACGYEDSGVGFAEPLRPQVLTVEQPSSVLFIGNSFTYFNEGIEYHLQRLAASSDPPLKLTVGQRTTPNQTFPGHHRDPRTEEAIVQEAWDIVILQGASDEPLGRGTRDSFFEYAELLVLRVRDGGATPALFMTWANRNRPAMTAPLHESYVRAGNQLGAIVIPVGLAWQRVLSDRSNRYLYSDNRHPSVEGTYLAACVVYASLFGTSPEGFAYTASLSREDALYLQQVAWKTTALFYEREK